LTVTAGCRPQPYTPQPLRELRRSRGEEESLPRGRGRNGADTAGPSGGVPGISFSASPRLRGKFIHWGLVGARVGRTAGARRPCRGPRLVPLECYLLWRSHMNSHLMRAPARDIQISGAKFRRTNLIPLSWLALFLVVQTLPAEEPELRVGLIGLDTSTSLPSPSSSTTRRARITWAAPRSWRAFPAAVRTSPRARPE